MRFWTTSHTPTLEIQLTTPLTKFAGFLTAALLASATFLPTVHAATAPLSDGEAGDLTFMREEEKLARDTYLTLYETWNLEVFANIAGSEQRHMDAILQLLDKYALEDPAASTSVGEFVDADLQALHDLLVAKGSQGALEGLKVGGIIEETDMIDIKDAIERSQHGDIDAVYESLLCGSRNHLRAFAGSIEAMTGEAYVPQLAESDPAEISAILASPMEKCGGSGRRRGKAPRRGR